MLRCNVIIWSHSWNSNVWTLATTREQKVCSKNKLSTYSTAPSWKVFASFLYSQKMALLPRSDDSLIRFHFSFFVKSITVKRKKLSECLHYQFLIFPFQNYELATRKEIRTIYQVQLTRSLHTAIIRSSIFICRLLMPPLLHSHEYQFSNAVLQID